MGRQAPLSIAGLMAALLLVAASACGPTDTRKPQQPPAPEVSLPAPELPDVVVVPAPTDAPAPAAPTWPDEPFRAERPAPRPVPELKLPTITPFTLPNGLEVFLVSEDTLPTVLMIFEFDTGGVDDPPGKTGLASVCADLFTEGTERLDKIAFAEELADHALTIWSPSGKETTTLNLRTLAPQLGAGLDLIGELLSSPGLRAEDFKRIIDQRKANLAQSRATPRGIAMRLFSSLIWGRDHGYGRVQQEADLDAITLDDCRAFVGRLRPKGARLWVVGMVTEGELRAALGERLAAWEGEAPKPHALPPAPEPDGAIRFVQVDGAAQALVLVGHPGPKRSAPDYLATHLMAQIFGGSFSSRINMNLREDKGWAYGGRGDFTYRRQGSYLSVYASVENSTAALALREMMKEIAGMRAAEPKPEELKREREGAIEALPAKFSTPTKTLTELKRLNFFGLPLDYYKDYVASLRALDGAAIKAAAEAHLRERGLVALVVGDGAMKAKGGEGTVLEGLEALAREKLIGEGGLVVLDPDGNPVKR